MWASSCSPPRCPPGSSTAWLSSTQMSSGKVLSRWLEHPKIRGPETASPPRLEHGMGTRRELMLSQPNSVNIGLQHLVTCARELPHRLETKYKDQWRRHLLLSSALILSWCNYIPQQRRWSLYWFWSIKGKLVWKDFEKEKILGRASWRISSSRK